MNADELIESFKERFGDKILESKTTKKLYGVKKNQAHIVWLKIKRSVFKDSIKYLASVQFPHLAVISGDDTDKEIELNYHFSLNYGQRMNEISVNISTKLPKEDPRIETITDIIPGALTTEREIQEMLGVKVEGIPDSRRMFLSEEIPEGVYPWRKDEKGPHSLIRTLHDKKARK